MPAHTARPPRRPWVAVGVGSLLVALLSLLAWPQPSGGTSWPAVWPAAGAGFAWLCVQGRPALWGLLLGTLLWGAWAPGADWSTTLVLAAVTPLGPWVAWRRLRIRFTSTSQPFARQTTVVAFMREQALWGASLPALAGTAGLWTLNPQWTPEHALQGCIHLWFAFLGGNLLLAPLTWDMLISRTRSGLPRFFEKVGESMRAGKTTVAQIVLLALGASALRQWGLDAWMGALVLLLLPVLAIPAMRAAPLTAHVMALLGASSLLVTSAGRAGVSASTGAWPPPAWIVAGCLSGIYLLLATAHERRLALKRLERQADTDPLTNLLSLNGLYRKLEELSERSDEAGDTQFSETQAPTHRPALVSVRMTNAESMEQLLGARRSDVVERATGGALATAAPEVLWARTAKAHFVGLLTAPSVKLDELLIRINFAAVEARALLDDNVGRPLWAVAAVVLESDPMPPVEVVMACLRRTEQAAQDSRQVQVAAVDHESGHALKLEAEQAERIRQIIQRKQLVLYAQPIVANLDPRSLRHKYEVLIRLRDDQGHIISPGVFLPVAMRAGMMQILDMAVMEQTFEWFAAHPDALAALSHCAINLSGPTVASPVVAQRIAEGLQHHQLPAHKFTFEITESQAIANPAQATDTIQAIRACGCRVAIDDFGTGVATFDYLKRFDVDYIKIDGAFIKSLLDDPVDRVIVESVVKVAHELKVRTVAEFVSSTELHQAVTALGVDESQGFVFGAPKPLHEWFGLPG